MGGSIRMYCPNTLLCQGFMAECKAKGFTSFNSCGRSHLLNCLRTKHDSMLNLKSFVWGVPSECTTRTLYFAKQTTMVSFNSNVSMERRGLTCHKTTGDLTILLIWGENNSSNTQPSYESLPKK